MERELLLQAADDIEVLKLNCFSMTSYQADVAAYLIAAAGKRLPPADGPYFRLAQELGRLPNDRLLWVGGWTPEWKQVMEEIWPEGEAARAQVAAYAIRDYVETGGWA